MSVYQSGLDRSNPYRYNPAYKMHYPIEGTVVAVHLPADQSNRSKREVEYDVQPSIVGMGRINNAPLVIGVHGIVDAEEVLLRPMSLIIPDGTFNSETANPSSTDGDKVLVQFINGSFLKPVITHVLTHNYQGIGGSAQNDKFKDKTEILIESATAPGYPFGSGGTGETAAEMTPTPGKRLRHTKLNGTHLAVDTLGNIFINFKEHPDDDVGLTAGSVYKKLVIQNEGVDLLRIEKKDDDTVNVVMAESLTSDLLLQFANLLKAEIASGTATIGLGDTGDCDVTIGGTSACTLTVGDGAKSVPIGEALKDLWDKATGNGIVQYVTDLETAFTAWVVSPNDGGAALKAALGSRSVTTVESWPSGALSTKVTIPNG